MKPGKLVTLVVLGALGWQHQETLGRHAGIVREIGPIARTYSEMRMYRRGLMSEMTKAAGQPPRNVGSWLDRTYNRGARRASLDEWGSRYLVERGEYRKWYLRSCGPDRACRTRDDLVAPLFLDG